MRFQCDHCQSRYAIPDERVVGRVLKIRCKRCREVIEVIGPPAPGASGRFNAASHSYVHSEVHSAEHTTSVEKFPDAVTMGQPDELEHRRSGVYFPAQISRLRSAISRFDDEEQDGEPIWWTVIDGQRLGPLTRKELRVQARRGRVDMDNLVWCKGMDRWGRVDEIKAMRAVRASVRERDEAMRRPRRVTGMESGVFATTGLFDATALTQALREQGVVSLDTHIHAKAEQFPEVDSPSDIKHKHSLHQSGASVNTSVPDAMPDLPSDDDNTVSVAESSDWYVIDERLQEGLWQDLPPDFPKGMLRSYKLDFMPRRQGLKAAVAVAALLSLFIGSVGFAAWITRDGLTQLAAQVELPILRDRSPYIPAAAAVSHVRETLRPSSVLSEQGQGLSHVNKIPLNNKIVAPAITIVGTAQADKLASANTVQARPELRDDTVQAPIALAKSAEFLSAQQGSVEQESDRRDGPAETGSDSALSASDRSQLPIDVKPVHVPGLKPNTAVDPVARGLRAMQVQPNVAKDLNADSFMNAEQGLPQALTPMDVMQVVKQHRAQLKSCQSGLADDEGLLASGVETSVLVARDGRIHQVRVAANGPAALALQSCFAKVMSSWRFQRPDSELEVVMPVSF